ncbi:hypothetical protein HRI_004542700 [Hibiscus trionum]|uniref:Uncharacterized protein n=1 Tax=Hibiscus trionum TaxID=183268 RepID=A0A9W7J639_HIBTR|nr:hypothetical protein HRI_004542700 [Hibiscus trionum]
MDHKVQQCRNHIFSRGQCEDHCFRIWLPELLRHIDTGPGLKIEESHSIDMETYKTAAQSSADTSNSGDAGKDGNNDFEQLSLLDGKMEFPYWGSDLTSIVWNPIRAVDDKLARVSSSGPRRNKVLWMECGQ